MARPRVVRRRAVGRSRARGQTRHEQVADTIFRAVTFSVGMAMPIALSSRPGVAVPDDPAVPLLRASGI
jgi:hypothetical protein